MVCVYLDGMRDIDMVHPVSGRFWTEGHDFFEAPSTDLALINRHWYERLGFDILVKHPAMKVMVTEQKKPFLALASTR